MTSQLSRLINEHEKIVIISHIHPDGDAVGSLLALKLGLEQLDKKVDALLHDPVPEIFQFLPDWEKVKAENGFPEDILYLLVDMNDLSRSGFYSELSGKTLAFIDHHPKGDLTRMSRTYLHDEQASSSCELVYRLFVELGIRLTPAIATCLLSGMYTDTGGFQYTNTGTETLEIASELMKRGARLSDISRRIFHTKSIASLKLLGLALERLYLTQDGQCAISVITHADMEACGATAENIGGIIGELNSLPEVKMALLLAEIEPGMIRGTLRTGEGHRLRVNGIAKVLGGGGHPRAAGFALRGRLVPEGNRWKVIA